MSRLISIRKRIGWWHFDHRTPFIFDWPHFASSCGVVRFPSAPPFLLRLQVPTAFVVRPHFLKSCGAAHPAPDNSPISWRSPGARRPGACSTPDCAVSTNDAPPNHAQHGSAITERPAMQSQISRVRHSSWRLGCPPLSCSSTLPLLNTCLPNIRRADVGARKLVLTV